MINKMLLCVHDGHVKVEKKATDKFFYVNEWYVAWLRHYSYIPASSYFSDITIYLFINITLVHINSGSTCIALFMRAEYNTEYGIHTSVLKIDN